MNNSDPHSMIAIILVLFIVICGIIAVRSFSRLLGLKWSKPKPYKYVPPIRNEPIDVEADEVKPE